MRDTTKQCGGLMTSLTIDTSEIRCIDGLYSLNDLHKALDLKIATNQTIFQ